MNKQSNQSDNKEEVIVGNKLIAEFMGAIEETQQVAMSTIGKAKAPMGRFYLPKNGRFPNNMYTCSLDDFKYHTSWDWLMPVCEKIWEIQISVDSREWENFCFLRVHNKIDKVWETVVQFIQWYNTQSQSTVNK